MRYDAYVSYCRSVDAHVARALREGLEQLARPGPGRRTLDVFLDDPARPVTADRGGPEPPWLDLRWARDASAQDGSVDLRNPRFHEAVTALAAPMHGIPRGEMEVRDFREYARSSRRRRAAMCGLAVLAAAALAGSCAGYQAQQASEARVALAGAQQAAARARADASWRSELSALADARTANLLRTLAERGGPVAFQQPADSAEEAAAVSPHRAPLRTPKRKPGLAPLADHPGRSPLRQGPGDHLS